MVRYEDWPLRLSNFLYENRNAQFIWGENDCILFGAKCIEALTGVNFYNEYLGYTTREEAEEIVKNHKGIHNIVKKHLGEPRKYVMKACRGDLAMVRTPERTIGVVDDTGKSVACLSDGYGLVRYDLKRANLVWGY